MISHAVVLAVTAELPMLNAIADEVVAILTLSVPIGPIDAVDPLAVCMYDDMFVPFSIYSLPTAHSIIPVTPSKSDNALPITVPINGEALGLAKPSPPETSISPL